MGAGMKKRREGLKTKKSVEKEMKNESVTVKTRREEKGADLKKGTVQEKYEDGRITNNKTDKGRRRLKMMENISKHED